MFAGRVENQYLVGAFSSSDETGLSWRRANATKQTPVFIDAHAKQTGRHRGTSRLNAAICAKLNRGGQDGTICYIPGDPSARPFGQRNPVFTQITRLPRFPGGSLCKPGRGQQQQQAEHIIQLCRFAITRNGMTVFFIGRMYDFSAWQMYRLSRDAGARQPRDREHPVVERLLAAGAVLYAGPQAAEGKLCPEGWTLTPFPGPQFKTVAENGSAEASFYTWVDQQNTFGLGDRQLRAIRPKAGGVAVGRVAGRRRGVDGAKRRRKFKLSQGDCRPPCRRYPNVAVSSAVGRPRRWSAQEEMRRHNLRVYFPDLCAVLASFLSETT
jgi:hypothetical protein